MKMKEFVIKNTSLLGPSDGRNVYASEMALPLSLFPFFYKIIFLKMRELRNHFAQKYPILKVILYREKNNK